MSASYDWIREIKPEIKNLDAIPLTGAAPPFPWDQLAERLSQSFDRENIQIKPGEVAWRSKDQLYEGLGDSLTPLIFAVPTLQGSVCWVMPEQEIATLESSLLTKESHPISFQDRSLSEAFYRFLTLEVLYNISQINFDKSLIPILTNQTKLPAEDSLCWDISVSVQDQTIWGRLIISPELRRSWVEHFAKVGHSSELAQEMAKKIDVNVHFEIGRTLLSLEEWQSVKLGDWIALDYHSISSDDLSGQIKIAVNGKNLFEGELQDGNVKILGHASHQEVDTYMAKEHDEEHEEDDTFDDLDDLTGTDEEFDLDEETLDTDEDLDLDEETMETTETEEGVLPAQETPKEASKRPSTEATRPSSTQRVSSTPIQPGEIPISLVVEIGRIHMTIDKLLALEPGNLLDLNVHPEDGVDLVVNGKVVGKGELVHLGESLGVRILELGN